MKKRLIKRPLSSGQSMIELCAGLIILVPIIMGLVDIAFVIAAMQINDAACRDAARAAAAGPPDQAYQRAQQVVLQAYKNSSSGGYIDGPSIEQSGVTTNPATIADPGPFGGPYQGTVRTRTTVILRLPVPVPMLPATQQFASQQEFPITYVKPNTATIP